MHANHVKALGLAVLVSASLLSACGKDDPAAEAAAPAPSIAMKGTSGKAVDMNGTWKLCSVRSQNGGSDLLFKATFNGSAMSITLSAWTTHTTANCAQTTTPDLELSVGATVALGAEGTAVWVDPNGASAAAPAGITGPVNATKATVTPTSASVTLHSAAYVT